MGPELLTNSELNNVDEMRPMAVAYHLMLDQKRKIEQGLGLFYVEKGLIYSLNCAESDQVSVVPSTANVRSYAIVISSTRKCIDNLFNPYVKCSRL